MSRVVMVLGVVCILIASCATVEHRPDAFDGMAADEVGCTILSGDAEPVIVGPLGPFDSVEIEPNEFLWARIGRIPDHMFTVVTTADRESHASIAIDQLPRHEVLSRSPFVHAGEPGWTLRCWRGN